MRNISIKVNDRVTTQFRRYTENDFGVETDWDKSKAGLTDSWALRFNGDDTLEISMRDRPRFEIFVNPKFGPDAVIVDRKGEQKESPFQNIVLDAPVEKKDQRKVALQVASAIIQVPFLETMLELPVEPPTKKK